MVACVLGLAMTGCSESEPTGVVVPATKNPFESAVRLGDVVPLASGAAYLVSTSSVYYVVADKAVVVSGLPTGLRFIEVQPLADGTAILTSQLGGPPAMYWLRASKATVVSETSEQLSVGVTPNLREGFLFATNQRLRTALKTANDQATGHEIVNDSEDRH